MATKAQFEDACRQYEQLRQRGRTEQEAKQFGRAVETARLSIPFMQDLIRYQRKYQQLTIANLPTVNTILHYAPPLFLAPALDALSDWWETLSKTEKQSVANLPNEVETAREVMQQAANLWGAAANVKTPIAKPPGQRPAAILSIWHQAGLVAFVEPNEFTLITHLRRHLEAKCTKCGFRAFGSLPRLLEPILCPACGNSGLFTITKRWL